jgi:hypothetical protein
MPLPDLTLAAALRIAVAALLDAALSALSATERETYLAAVDRLKETGNAPETR